MSWPRTWPHPKETGLSAGVLRFSPNSWRCCACVAPGWHVPTAERTLDPARMFTESLTPGPELENDQDPKRSFECVGYLGSRVRRCEKAPGQAKSQCGPRTEHGHALDAGALFGRGEKSFEQRAKVIKPFRSLARCSALSPPSRQCYCPLRVRDAPRPWPLACCGGLGAKAACKLR
jgi:hypothetical protein